MTQMAKTRTAARVESVGAEKLSGESLSRRVRRDHAMIRALLDETERAGAAALMRRAGGIDRFRGAVWDLFIAFDDHVAMEESNVLPLLRTLDEQGGRRAMDMLAEHDEQRRVMLELVEDTECDAKEVDALVAQADALVLAFRDDMLVEERWLAAVVFDGGSLVS